MLPDWLMALGGLLVCGGLFATGVWFARTTDRAGWRPMRVAIDRLHLERGEVLVFRFLEPIGGAQIGLLQQHLKETLPDWPVLVLDSRVSVFTMARETVSAETDPGPIV